MKCLKENTLKYGRVSVIKNLYGGKNLLKIDCSFHHLRNNRLFTVEIKEKEKKKKLFSLSLYDGKQVIIVIEIIKG